MSGNYWSHKETAPPLDKMLLKISDLARCMGRRICTNVSWMNKKHKSEILNDEPSLKDGCKNISEAEERGIVLIKRVVDLRTLL